MDKEHDDKVAVLEFELRKAYDTIKSLRGSLTEATGESGRARLNHNTIFVNMLGSPKELQINIQPTLIF